MGWNRSNGKKEIQNENTPEIILSFNKQIFNSNVTLMKYFIDLHAVILFTFELLNHFYL